MGAKSKAKAESDATLRPQGATADELTANCPDLEQWPRSWMYEERDLSHGQQMVECFKPFLRHLVSSGPSRKTLRSHRDNLWILGGEIISKLHEDPRLRSARQTRSCSRSSTTKVDRSSPTGPKISNALSTRPAESSFAFSKSVGRPISSQAMDMWTTQERCPHAHSLNNRYKRQTKVEAAKD